MRKVLNLLFGASRPLSGGPGIQGQNTASGRFIASSSKSDPTGSAEGSRLGPDGAPLASPALLSNMPLPADLSPASSATQAGLANLIRCFAEGTAVLTEQGEKPVEHLRDGNRILTRDNGFQPLMWSGIRELTAWDAANCSDLRPILLRKDMFGSGVPGQDLVVSAQHKVLISGEGPLTTYGEREVLVSAADLRASPPIRPVRRYVHLLFERHEIIWANGAWTESFQPDDHAIGLLGRLHPSTFANATGPLDGTAWRLAARQTVRPAEARA